MHCTECGYNCHEKCVQHVPKNCCKVRPASQLSSLAAAAASTNARSATVPDSGTDATLVASPTAATRGTLNTCAGVLNTCVSTLNTCAKHLLSMSNSSTSEVTTLWHYTSLFIIIIIIIIKHLHRCVKHLHRPWPFI